ncbi:MAG: putative quinol monooxygenase [Paracoccaceae bacterium]
MGIVHLIGQLTCATAEDIALVAKHLPTHIALSRAEPGCLSFNCTQTDDPMIWQVDETFTDQAAFDAHQTRTRASEWYRLTAHIPRHYVTRTG